MEYPLKSSFGQIKCFINMVRHLDVHTLIYFFRKIYTQNRPGLALQQSSSVSVLSLPPRHEIFSQIHKPFKIGTVKRAIARAFP